VMNGSLKIGLLAAAGALIVGAAAIGTALAQRTPTPATAAGQAAPSAQREQPRRMLELVASKLGVTPERLQQAFTEARQELGWHRGPGGPARERRGEIRERVRGMMQRGMEIVAGEIHISVEQLRSELPGSSLAAVSRNHGVDPQQVANALTNAANQRIDAAQAEGRMTLDRATRLKQRTTDLIQRMMDRQLPARPVR
jgi:hypothetical protein